MNAKGKSGVAFLVLGLAFVALGIGGQRAFLFAGLVFIVIGVVAALRRRREGGP